jgi:hypothetical protein
MLVIDKDTRALWLSQARKERIRAFLEGVGAVVTLALFAILAWLFLVVTPDQRSAECEAVTEELQR